MNAHVLRIKFKGISEEHAGIILWERWGWFFVYNFSDDLDLDGFSLVNKSFVEKITKNGKKNKFYSMVVRLRGGVNKLVFNPPECGFDEYMGSIGSTVAVDYFGGKGVDFLVGRIERIKTNGVGFRYVSPLGVWSKGIDFVEYEKIIRIKLKERYLVAFDLIGEFGLELR